MRYTEGDLSHDIDKHPSTAKLRLGADLAAVEVIMRVKLVANGDCTPPKKRGTRNAVKIGRK